VQNELVDDDNDDDCVNIVQSVHRSTQLPTASELLFARALLRLVSSSVCFLTMCFARCHFLCYIIFCLIMVCSLIDIYWPTVYLFIITPAGSQTYKVVYHFGLHCFIAFIAFNGQLFLCSASVEDILFD